MNKKEKFLLVKISTKVIHNKLRILKLILGHFRAIQKVKICAHGCKNYTYTNEHKSFHNEIAHTNSFSFSKQQAWLVLDEWHTMFLDCIAV